MLEIVVLKCLELGSHGGREALAALPPVDEKALKMEARVFALRPQIANPVDDARVQSSRRYWPNVGGQRGEPLDRAVVEDVVAGVDGAADGLPIGDRVRHQGQPWGRFSSRNHDFTCKEHFDRLNEGCIGGTQEC